MKIVDPGFEILDRLDRESLAVRIEYCGRICYRSEHRITAQSAVPFVEKMAEHGHNSVLEMGVVSLRVACGAEDVAALYRCQPRYLVIDEEEGGVLVTGSVRAFRELAVRVPKVRVVQAAAARIARTGPWFFPGMDFHPGPLAARKVPLEEIDALPAELLARHRFVAVRFVVNRAVTHEIVRHRPCSFLQESQRYCRYADGRFGGEVSFIRPMFFAPDSAEYRLWEEAMAETERLYLKLLETSSPQAARTVLPNSCKTEIIVHASLEEWAHIFRLRTSRAAEPSMREVMVPLAAEMARRFPAVLDR